MRLGQAPNGLASKPRLLLPLQATSTRQRVDALRQGGLSTKERPALAADSLYRTVNELPAKLKYDLERRRTKRALQVAALNSASSLVMSSSTSIFLSSILFSSALSFEMSSPLIPT